jgi:hypothetical protein
MIEPSDIIALRQMQELLVPSRFQKPKIGDLAEHLLMLRDSLRFEDFDWFHALTQQIATLDSASTFVSSNSQDEAQLNTAIMSAVDEALQLIRLKLA